MANSKIEEKEIEREVELKVELAVMRKDIDAIREKVVDAIKELETIKSYFNKVFIGIVALVGTYIVKWILSGGLGQVL